MKILCIIGVLFFVFEKALSHAVRSSFVLYVNYRKSKTDVNSLFCCYLTQFTSLQLFLTVDTVIILQNNDNSLVFVNSNCDWAKQIAWFISHNHSCCLQKQTKIELLVKRVYWVLLYSYDDLPKFRREKTCPHSKYRRDVSALG